MNLFSKQALTIVVLLVVGATIVWGVFFANQSKPSVVDESSVTRITVSEERIADQDGKTLVSVDDLANSIQVSKDASFGASESITDARLSPDKQLVAFSTQGAAHDAGWLYNIGSGQLTPVSFQYGGGISVIEWSPDSRFIAFQAGTPAPSEHIVLVDRTNIDGYVFDISH
jgi:dipeptidyl aminopeptidase/acylaminoacyl peptidase